jgi:hypothetical protein
MLGAALLCAAAPAAALAEEVPPFDGAMSFPAIQDSSGPEEFTWEVRLGEGQTLEQVDDQRAVVRYEDGQASFEIRAVAAHAADGATVPTTLAVTEPNLITLTVHHRAGNPAAGGAPFDYPVVAGQGWEGGFIQVIGVMPPPTEQTPPAVAVEEATCRVPRLSYRSLRAARRALRQSNCSLGPVRGERARGARVVKQYRRPGAALPAGAEVGVKLG